MSILDNPQFPLEIAEQEELLTKQRECAFIWRTRDGWPVGTMMTYVWLDGQIWMTCGGSRPRVAAVRRDNRVSVIVSGQGPNAASLAVVIKGRCRLHNDASTKTWYFDRLTRIAFPDSEEARKAMRRLFSSPDRVILSVTPEKRFSYDSAKMSAALARALGS